MKIAERIHIGDLTYGDLEEGGCRRFLAQSPDGQRRGYGLLHPDGSAVVQWGNLVSRPGPACELFESEEGWGPLFVEFDTRFDGGRY